MRASPSISCQAVRWAMILGLCLVLSPAVRGAQLFLRGDANSDIKLDISDAIFSLEYTFLGGAAPGCMDAADANDDGRLDISDPVYSLLYMFKGTNRPPAPYPNPGADPTADSLGCGPVTANVGSLLLAIHDTPPADLTEFWITITEVKVTGTDGSTQKVFPPAATPEATKTLNLLDQVGASAIIATIEVPAGDYTAAEIEFDHAFARTATEDVTVVPDHGDTHLSFANPITVTEGNLTPLVVDFNLTASLADGGPGKVTLNPVVVEDEHEDEDEIELSEFHGKVKSVDTATSSFVVVVTSRQKDGGDPAATAEVTVIVDGNTRFEHADGLASLAADQDVEVKGALQEGGAILASKVELKGQDSGEDLDDDGIDDDDEDADHDSDIDNDGSPNDEDEDDDGDHLSDDQDKDHDNDGIPDSVDTDDDNDGIPDSADSDDDGDGIDDDADDDHDDDDGDGIPDTHDDDDDNDGTMDHDEDDSDGDGIPDKSDLDDDNDGVPDIADTDDDGDGVPDDQEEGDDHGDGEGHDRDHDGVADDSDNCPEVANPDQADADGDNIGDACDV